MICGIVAALTYPGCKVGYFRRTFAQLEGAGGAIQRSMELLTNTGLARYSGKNHTWKFKNGSILKFCHLEHEDSKFDYQSQQMDVILFDESTQFSRSLYRYMLTRNRATVDGITPFMALATNPGGLGHAWFRAEFVDIGEPEIPHEVEVEEGEFETHLFIPARLSDNQVLEQRDPMYRKKLESQPEVLRRQLLDGDWDAAEGVAFPEFKKSVHVIPPFAIPEDWIKFRSLDWGYSKPYSVGWYAVDYDGRIYKYRELYGWGGKPDVGTKEDPEDVARKIHEAEITRDSKGKIIHQEKITYSVADDAIFGGRQDNAPTIAEQFATAGVYWQPVGKGPKSRIAGKLEIHHRLKYTNDEPPMVQIFNTCKHFLRTFPNLILSERNPEDVDTTLEDHSYDQFRYALQSRPMVTKRKEPPKTRIQEHKEKLSNRHKSVKHLRIV